MKKLLFVSALLLLLPLSAGAQVPQPWQMKKFEANIEVRADGYTVVRETVVADFSVPRHGIYRFIPVSGRDTAGKAYNLKVEFLGAADETGRPYPVKKERLGGKVVWRIGDPNRTVSGEHTYVIDYFVKNAIGRFQDHDELYWNVSGEDWEVPLSRVSAFVTLPAGVQESEVRTECYAGPYGSTAKDCSVAVSGNISDFAANKAGDPLTVVVGWPKGLVGEPPWRERAADFVRSNFIWALPAVLFIVLYLVWKKYGSDPKLGTLVVQYDPPADLTPAETKAVLTQHSTATELSPTIIDLAVRGFLTIRETETQVLLFKSKDYVLTNVPQKADSAKLKTFETVLLADLFASGEETKISSLRQKFYAQSKAFSTGVIDRLTADGYFVGNPLKIRNAWNFGAIALFIILAIFLHGLVGTEAWPIFAALMICALEILVFGNYMPKWSDKGVEAGRIARGFKEFISKVDKYRAPWMETQAVEMYEKYLPYALVFGLGKKWSEAFAGLVKEPPRWYQGAAIAAWSPAAFANELNSWTQAVNSAAVQPRSSGSGFGGGGFSGGGGGGGGGGSW